MMLTGSLFIGAQEVPASAGSMKALNPATNAEIEPPFAFGGRAEVDRAARLADEAFDSYNHTSLAQRAAFLERIADGLDASRQSCAGRVTGAFDRLHVRVVSKRMNAGASPQTETASWTRFTACASFRGSSKPAVSLP
ncbi:hypothetical protein PPGU19_076540 (plasmid) [Paraburkholderia sp. PGU19]|nr:hypothetical protein PPGU19_076540 [Paraburkholderia sp. PGU19]